MNAVRTADLHCIGRGLIGGISVVCFAQTDAALFLNPSSCSHRLRYGKGYSPTQSGDKKLVNVSIVVLVQLYCVVFVGFYTHNGPVMAQHACMAAVY